MTRSEPLLAVSNDAMRFALGLVVTTALTAVDSAAAQPASLPEPTFEVASIKPNNSASQAGAFQWRADGITQALIPDLT